MSTKFPLFNNVKNTPNKHQTFKGVLQWRLSILGKKHPFTVKLKVLNNCRTFVFCISPYNMVFGLLCLSVVHCPVTFP